MSMKRKMTTENTETETEMDSSNGKEPPVILRPGDTNAISTSVDANASTTNTTTAPHANITLNVNTVPGTVTPIGTRKIKAPPICRVPALRKEHMAVEQLSKFCFDPQDILEPEVDSSVNADVNVDADANAGAEVFKPREDKPHTVSPREWADYKRNILNKTESRNGRDLQKYGTDQSGQLMRLTTGCIPIMNDGRILLISSSRKGEWILPKGGWESDEHLEVSALRETYEEGGMLGTLGPKLSDVEYETRKGKKKRLELESLKKKCEIVNGIIGSMPGPLPLPVTTAPPLGSSSAVSVQSTTSSVYQSEDDQLTNSTHGVNTTSNTSSSTTNNSTPNTIQQPLPSTGRTSSAASSPTNKDCLATIIRNQLTSLQATATASDRHDDSGSVASIASITSDGSTVHTHVRMTMFPLYVLEVREHWPESGRARKLVDIDTAIDIMSSRPEFHKVLVEAKSKGYHLGPKKRLQTNANTDTDTSAEEPKKKMMEIENVR